jgi:hypothetical protein
VGPSLPITTTHVLKLFKNEAKNVITWRAVWDDKTAGPAWTFEPATALVDHLTKTAYEAATQPATAPATKP